MPGSVRRGSIIGQAQDELRVKIEGGLPMRPELLRQQVLMILEDEMEDSPAIDIEDAIRYYHITKRLIEVAHKVKHEPIGSAVPVPTIKLEVGDTELELRAAKLVVVRRDT